MAVWPFLMAFAALTLCAGLFVRDGFSVLSASMILLCYALVQVVKWAIPISGEYYEIACAAIWILATGAIWRHTATMAGNAKLLQYAVPVLINISVLGYLWARLAGVKPEIGSPPYVASDLLMILAMLCIWRGVWDDLVDRVASLADRGGLVVYNHGDNSVRSGNVLRSGLGNEAAHQEEVT